MRNIKTYYLARKLYLRGFRLLPKLFGRLSRLLYSCEIAYTADIHESVVFPHKGLGVVIGHNVTIGKNSKILQHVTVGGRSGISKNPLIGQNVLIGAGAILLGDIIIGDNVKIGAGAVVVKDIPSNTTVVGEQAKILES